MKKNREKKYVLYYKFEMILPREQYLGIDDPDVIMQAPCESEEKRARKKKKKRKEKEEEES